MNGQRFPSRPVRIGLAAMLLCGLACRDAPPGVQGENRQVHTGVAVVGLTADLDSLNPYLSVRAATRDVAYHIYESLLLEEADFKDGSPTFSPALAERWEQAADGRSLTFFLRPDAQWSDGTPLTAEDVRFSHQAATHPDVAWLAADVKKEIEAVEVVDPHTVRYRFRRAYPYQLMDANDGIILPAHIWGAIPFHRWRSDAPRIPKVVSGPFTVKDWTPGQSIELVANPRHYARQRPRLNAVAFRILPDAVAGFEQFLAGRIDHWDRVDPRQMQRVLDQPGLTLHRYPDRYYGFIGWNCRRALFREAAVRRALTLAINRQRLARDILHDVAVPAAGPVPPAFGPRLSQGTPWPYDPAAAASLLDDSGWRAADGNPVRINDQGQPFRFALQVNADAPWRRDMALLIQEDLRQVGIDVRIVSLERRAYGAAHRAGDFDAFIGGWRLPTKIDLAVTFATWAQEEGVNYGGYSNAQLDDLLATAAQAPSFAAAWPHLEQALALVHTEQPYTFLYWQDRLVGIADRIDGARPNAQSALFNLADWSLAPASGEY